MYKNISKKSTFHS